MTAVVGKKLGMSRIYTNSGEVIPVTLIKIYEGLISNFQKYDDRDYNHITISYGKDKKTEKRIKKPVLGFYRKNNLEPHDNMKTFKVNKDGEFNVGDFMGLNALKEGFVVDVTGISKGKGFAGAMKRHGFGGLEAAHGVSISHRSIGGTGTKRREGRVMKGKKMAGHMGFDKVTVKNLKIVKIENDDNVICVKGAVPGCKGAELVIKTSNV